MEQGFLSSQVSQSIFIFYVMQWVQRVIVVDNFYIDAVKDQILIKAYWFLAINNLIWHSPVRKWIVKSFVILIDLVFCSRTFYSSIYVLWCWNVCMSDALRHRSTLRPRLMLLSINAFPHFRRYVRSIQTLKAYSDLWINFHVIVFKVGYVSFHVFLDWNQFWRYYRIQSANNLPVPSLGTTNVLKIRDEL